MLKYFWECKYTRGETMRFIISILVAMVLTHMAFYVLANMNNADYSMNTATIVGVIVGILAILAGETTVSEQDA